MRRAIVSFVCLLIPLSYLFSQSQTNIPSIEMTSNGNGVIADTEGFVVTYPPINYGAYSADWYRDALAGGQNNIRNLPGGMQAGGGWYFVVAGPNTIGDYASALNRWTRNGARDIILAGNSYEIRFTEGGGKASMAFTTETLTDVPFEVWYLGKTLHDTNDDVRMFPWVYDDNGNDLFDFKLDHQAAGDENDPYSDWIYFIMPADNTPGESGYNSSVQEIMDGTYDYDDNASREHLARVVLMNWNQRQYESDTEAADGPVDAMPENGTIFRMNMGYMVEIDIKPGSEPNSVNCLNPKEIIPVAVLTTDYFNALRLDPASVTFGPDNATEIHEKGHVLDVDGDGDMDMLFHFQLGETGIQCVHTKAELRGYTLEGRYIWSGGDIKSVHQTVGCDIDAPGEHDWNNVRILVHPDGRWAYHETIPAYGFFPAKTCNRYIYTSGIWVGGLVDGEAIVAEASHISEFTPSEIGETGTYYRVFNSNFEQDKKNWPPEFSDARGKAVIVPGAQNLVVEYNDYFGNPWRDVKLPLGIEVRQRSLEFKKDSLQNAVIITWELKNISGNSISECCFGFWSDSDIGDANDDRASFVNEMAITWDHSFDEYDFTEKPGLTALDFLETPGNRGATNYVTFTNGGPNSDPRSDAVEYAFLSGTNSYETDWIGDVRTLLCTGPFDLAIGEAVVVSAAKLFAHVPAETYFLEVDPVMFRPDPYDPILSELLNTQKVVRRYYDSSLKGKGLPKYVAEPGDKKDPISIPTEYSLSQNHPNPFNPVTKIIFSIPDNGINVELEIFNALGQKVDELYTGHVNAGVYEFERNAYEWASGVYFCRLRAGEYENMIKMLLVK